jgi:kynureninase
MGPTFDPIPGAEGWQLSNPPIFQLAAMRASLEIFDSATIEALRAKSERLTGYLEFLLKRLASPKFKIVTPANSGERGSQLSLRVTDDAKGLTKKWIAGGVICDFREPDIIRVAPTALYNRFSEVYRFAEIMAAHLEHRS